MTSGVSAPGNLSFPFFSSPINALMPNVDCLSQKYIRYTVPGTRQRYLVRFQLILSLDPIALRRSARCTPQGKRRYDHKQRGFGGQTKPIFHKKVGHVCMRVYTRVGNAFAPGDVFLFFFVAALVKAFPVETSRVILSGCGLRLSGLHYRQ